VVHRSKEGEVLILVIFLHNTYKTDQNDFLESLGVTSNKEVNFRKIEPGELITLAKRGIKLATVIIIIIILVI
jgi:hypothetical protein